MLCACCCVSASSYSTYCSKAAHTTSQKFGSCGFLRIRNTDAMDPTAGSAVAGPSVIRSGRKVRSKWELEDDDELSVLPIKQKKKVKTFSSGVDGTPGRISIRSGSESVASPSRPGTPSALDIRAASSARHASHPVLQGCRSVYCYERLNHIEEGSYGVVSRARDKETGDIVALKKLKMDQERNGFPITSLREIRTLMMVGHHENVVRVREIVVGDTLTQ